MHCWHRNQSIVDYCKKTGVHVTAYSPTGGNPDYEGARPRGDPTVIELAKKNGRAINQVGLPVHLHGFPRLPKADIERSLQRSVCPLNLTDTI